LKAPALTVIFSNIFFLAFYYLFSSLYVFLHLTFTLYFITGYILPYRKPLFSLPALVVATLSFFPGTVIILVRSIFSPPVHIDFLLMIRLLSVAVALGIVGVLAGKLLIRLIQDKIYRNSLFAGIVVFLATTVINAYNHSLQLSLAGLSYIVVILILFLKTKERFLYQGLLVLAPFLILLMIPALIFKMPRTYPSFIVVPLSIMIGWIMATLILRRRFTIVSLSAVISLLLVVAYYFAMQNWLAYLYIDKEKNHSSLSLEMALNDACIIPDCEDQKNHDSYYSGRSIKVLYFFTRYCSVCFQKMPELESLHKDFFTDPRVEIIAVNVQTNQADTIFDFHGFYQSKGYSFPFRTVVPESATRFTAQLNIKGYPHVLVIDDHFQPIYIGGFQTGETYLVGNIRRIIRKNLNIEQTQLKSK
jgi:thiol-disulfide isomerase/thioredoxin